MNIIQFELWLDCPNNCAFCAIREFKNFNLNKANCINKAIQELNNIDYTQFDELCIIGGELLIPDLTTIEINLLLTLFNKIKALLLSKKLKKFYIVSSLLNNCPYLKDILNIFNDKKIINSFSINTSWDYKYRFNKDNKIIWHNNIDLIKSYGIDLHYETILTDDLIIAYLNDNKEVLEKINSNQLDLIRPSDSYSHSNRNLKGFFPSRNNFFKFMQKLKTENKELFNNLFNLEKRASKIYTFPTDVITSRLNKEYIEEINDTLAECKHDILYTQCYKDSNKCIICDLLKFKDEING